ncbi:MAG: hypothetical protein LBP63_08380 [Prevotellaceae bacterium]|jgi:beta-lactam-binding protein with PASTA domain|nr:hypothetical protein [Prevotellaceae bacterium]
MKIFINDSEIEIFAGATIESAIRKLDKKILNEIKKGKSEVYDRYGNRVSISGPLHENSQITIKKITQ